MRSTKAFSIIVTAGVAAFIFVVGYEYLNPAELFRQLRDAGRLADVIALERALRFYGAESGNVFGGERTIYVSIPDLNATSTDGTDCRGMDLPKLPPRWKYHCPHPATLQSPNAVGWIPFRFPPELIRRIPVDIKNTPPYYYMYAVSRDGWELNLRLEAKKFNEGGVRDVSGRDGGDSKMYYELGTKLNISPLK